MHFDPGQKDSTMVRMIRRRFVCDYNSVRSGDGVKIASALDGQLALGWTLQLIREDVLPRARSHQHCAGDLADDKLRLSDLLGGVRSPVCQKALAGGEQGQANPSGGDPGIQNMHSFCSNGLHPRLARRLANISLPD